MEINKNYQEHINTEVAGVVPELSRSCITWN